MSDFDMMRQIVAFVHWFLSPPEIEFPSYQERVENGDTEE